MRRLIRLSGLLVVLLGSVWKPATPQQNAPGAKITARTNVVLVPVVVSDKHGNHIQGLTRNDFEIKEGGKPQQIMSFEEITAEATPIQKRVAAPATFTNEISAGRPKELEIIVLDLINTPFLAQAEARRGLIEFLSKSTAQNALLALVVFRSSRVILVHNFTSDPAILISAIRKLQATPVSRDLHTANVSGDDDAEAAQLGMILAGEAADTSTTAGAKIAVAGIGARNDASRQDVEGLITLQCFQQVAQYFAAVPGRKSLVWASTGFNLGSAPSLAADQFGGTTVEDWRRTVRALQDANIAVYPVDVGGLASNPSNIESGGNPGGNSFDVERYVGSIAAAADAVSSGRIDPLQSKHETMHVIADSTGGQPFYNNNDLEGLFRRASEDSAQYYMLSYATIDSGKAGWRKLEVKVRREGLQVHTRSGFFFSTASTRNQNAARQVDEALAAGSSLNFSALPISGSWQQIEPAGNKRKARFSLTLPAGAATIDTADENHLNLDILVIATDENGKDAARTSQHLDRHLPAAGVAQVQATGITYVNSLTLLPGRYTVHFVVRDNLSRKIGSVSATLKVE